MLNFYKTAIITFVFVIGAPSIQAQNKMPDPTLSDVQILTQQGSLASVKVVVGEPIKIFVFGREEAQLDFSNLKINGDFDSSGLSIQVKKIRPSSKSILTLVKHDDHLTVTDPEQKNKPYELEVTTKVDNKPEHFKFKIDHQKKKNK